jgi:hypothetical protein
MSTDSITVPSRSVYRGPDSVGVFDDVAALDERARAVSATGVVLDASVEVSAASYGGVDAAGAVGAGTETSPGYGHGVVT